MRKEGKRLVYSVVLAILLSIALVMSSIVFVMAVAEKQNDHMQSYLIELATENKNVLLKQIEGDFQTLHATAVFAAEEREINLQRLIPLLKVQNNGNAFIRMGFVTTDAVGYFVDIDGTDYFGVDMSDRDYIVRALRGEECVSAILDDKMGGEEPVNVYAVPVWHEEQIIGAICAIHLSSNLCDLIDDSFFNNSGFVRVVTKEGNVVMRSSHNVSSPSISNMEGLSFYSQKDRQRVSEQMKSGEKGSFSYLHNGGEYLCGFVPIGINDWYIASSVPKEAVTADFKQVIEFSTVACIAVLILFLLLLFYNYKTMKKGTESINRLAYYDTLTGCYNKNKFSGKAMQLLQHHHANSAIVMLNIVNFKFINEAFGFETGDRLLRHMAEVLADDMRDTEIFYRDNADRFGALLQFESRGQLTARVEHIMENITNYTFHAERFHFVCCAGIKVVDEFSQHSNLDLLLDRASMALQKAKRGHENNYAFYDSELHSQVARKNLIENEMKEALKRKEFVAFLQPKYDLRTGKISGAEALTRWKSPKYGMIAPDQFIPIFEQNGFITQLDMYILEEVCHTLKRWTDAGQVTVPVSVNQSRLLFYQEDYPERVYSTVKNIGVAPGLVMLEVTESIVMEDMVRLREVLAKLQKMGFSISMDDFGAGYSSLNTLKNIYIDEIKLDRIFMTQATDQQRSASIVKKMIELTKELSIKTVAEGVETQQQVEFLKSIYCDAAQGFFYARPMEMTDFERLLEKENS